MDVEFFAPLKRCQMRLIAWSFKRGCRGLESEAMLEIFQELRVLKLTAQNFLKLQLTASETVDGNFPEERSIDIFDQDPLEQIQGFL